MNVGDENARPAAAGRRPRILFVSHEASRTGAPMFLLHLLRWLRAHTTLEFEVLLGRPGPLGPEFARLAAVHSPADFAGDPASLAAFDLIYSNTACNGTMLETLPYGRVPVVTHVHELDSGIECIGARNAAGLIRQTGHFVACAEVVADSLRRRFRLPPAQVSVHHEMIPPDRVRAAAAQGDERALRAEHGIPADAAIVLGCGTIDPRKGTDLFLALAAAVRARPAPDRPVCFVWIGKANKPEFLTQAEEEMRRRGLTSSVRFIGELANPHGLMAQCNVFCLTSREDPFPLVMLEAAALGRPVLCFEGSGGAVEFCAHGGGIAVPYLEADAMAAACVELLADPARAREIGRRGRESVEAHFSVEAVAPRLWAELSGWLRVPPPLPEARTGDEDFATIVRRWDPATLPQRAYVEHYLKRQAVYAETRAMVAAGRLIDAAGRLVRVVRDTVEANDPRALVEAMAEVAEEMLPIDPPKARYFSDEAQKRVVAAGGRIVLQPVPEAEGPRLPRRVSILPLPAKFDPGSVSG